MTGKVSDRPPRKKPSEEVFSSRRVMKMVRPAANRVNARKENRVMVQGGGKSLHGREAVYHHVAVGFAGAQNGGGELRLIGSIREVLGFQAKGTALGVGDAAFALDGAIHEGVKLASGGPALLKGIKLYHYSYADLSDYFKRFNRYTSAIAENHRDHGRRVPILSHVVRPWIEFISRYFLRLGFLDGYPGYTYALVSSLYAYIKYAKLKEIQGKMQ